MSVWTHFLRELLSTVYVALTVCFDNFFLTLVSAHPPEKQQEAN